VGERGVPVSSGGVGVGEIDQQAAAGADERGRETGEGIGELVDGFGGAEAGEGMTAPAVEVGAAEEHERQLRVDWVGR
jgi:hypothetical protein